MISIVVVLPAPFGPSSAVTWPGAAVKLTPATAVKPPYRLTRPSTSMALIAPVPGAPARGAATGRR